MAMSVKFYEYIAKLLASMTGKAFASVFKETTGQTLDTWMEKEAAAKSRRSNLRFRNFNLVRYAQKDQCRLIGKIPAHDGTATQVYEIECRRAPFESNIPTAYVMRNGVELFTVHARSYARVQNCAIAALHAYLGRTRHAHKKNRTKGGAA